MIIATTAHQEIGSLIPRSGPASVTIPQMSTNAPISRGQKWILIGIMWTAVEIDL